MSKAVTVSDSFLLQRFASGDLGAFEELVHRYSSRIFGLAYRLTRNVEDAQEVHQDVFVTVYRKIRDFQGKSAFSSWLYRVAVNTALMRLRKRRASRDVSVEDIGADYVEQALLRASFKDTTVDRHVEQNRLSRMLESAIGRLPAEYRPVFVLRDIDGLSAREVGKILEISIPAVKSRLHRSRMMLRRRLLPIYRELYAGSAGQAASRCAANDL